MDLLDRLQRERYLVLRSLRVAHDYLDRLEAGQVEEDERLGDLIEFLRHFALDHFFAQEEALLEEWERRQAIQGHLGELFLLRQEHQLGRALLQSVAEQVRRRAEEQQRRQEAERVRQLQEQARRQRAQQRRIREQLLLQEQQRLLQEQQRRQVQDMLCSDLGKLITQLSRSLVRGQNALRSVEVRVTRDRNSGEVRQLEARLTPKPSMEERYRALLEELEARSMAAMGMAFDEDEPEDDFDDDFEAGEGAGEGPEEESGASEELSRPGPRSVGRAPGD